MIYTHTRLLVDRYTDCFIFYRDVMKLECTWGDETSHYAQFQAGGIQIALFDKAEMLEDLGEKHQISQGFANEVVLIFAVQNVDAAYNRLKEDVEFLTQPHDREDWMIRVAQFRDPNGTLIEINQNI